jgi:hypothetical protein
VRKVGSIDLLDIADPDGKAKQGTVNGVYTMPFVTIENVDVIDATHILVGNDNDPPFSASRASTRPTATSSCSWKWRFPRRQVRVPAQTKGPGGDALPGSFR